MFNEDKVIPRDKMFEGIKLSKEKALKFLSDAELLVKNQIIEHSIIFVQCAIEEFGRAVALEEKLEEGSMDVYRVEEKLFKSHEHKERKAWTKLPSSLKNIYEGIFDPRIFDPEIFDTGETISHQTRKDATFVDWNGEKWAIGVRANKENVLRLIEGIRNKILEEP